MELLQLRYFYESAMAESHSHTAKKYMVPVSSVSASIKRLENELGIALFERTGNRIFLTEKGRQYLQTVQHILSELDRGTSNVTATQTSEERLTVLVRSLRRSVVRRAQRFQEQYPQVSFRLDLQSGKREMTDYDIVIAAQGDGPNGYESFPLANYAIRVEARHKDSLCQRQLTLSQLRDRVFVTPNSNGVLFKTFAKACEQHGFTPKVAMECNDYLCYNTYLFNSSALGLTMGNASSDSTSETEFLEITDLNERISIHAFYKKEAYIGNTKLFVDFLRNR